MLKQFNLKEGYFADPITTVIDEGQIIYEVSGDGWFPVYTLEEINHISASLTGGGKVWIDEFNRLKYSGKSPSPYHTWDGESWVINQERKAEYLKQVKADKLAEINRKAQAFVAEAAHLNDTPEFEQQTWQEQANEARAWHADNNTPTPKLDLLAKIRGIPVNTLRQKAYEKAVAYYNLSFVVMGQRQAYEDKLKKAKTIEAVLAIEPVYTLNVAD